MSTRQRQRRAARAAGAGRQRRGRGAAPLPRFVVRFLTPNRFALFADRGRGPLGASKLLSQIAVRSGMGPRHQRGWVTSEGSRSWVCSYRDAFKQLQSIPELEPPLFSPLISRRPDGRRRSNIQGVCRSEAAGALGARGGIQRDGRDGRAGQSDGATRSCRRSPHLGVPVVCLLV